MRAVNLWLAAVIYELELNAHQNSHQTSIINDLRWEIADARAAIKEHIDVVLSVSLILEVLFLRKNSQGKSCIWSGSAKVSDFLSSLVASFVRLYEKKNEILTGKYSSER